MGPGANAGEIDRNRRQRFSREHWRELERQFGENRAGHSTRSLRSQLPAREIACASGGNETARLEEFIGCAASGTLFHRLRFPWRHEWFCVRSRKSGRTEGPGRRDYFTNRNAAASANASVDSRCVVEGRRGITGGER